MSKGSGGGGRGGRKPVKGISHISGHELTSTEKRSVISLINNGQTSGRIGRTDYLVTRSGSTYTVKVRRNDRGLGFVGDRLRNSIYTGTFSVRR